jgi:hypothetical protein
MKDGVGVVYKTTDGGKTWKTKDLASPVSATPASSAQARRAPSAANPTPGARPMSAAAQQAPGHRSVAGFSAASPCLPPVCAVSGKRPGGLGCGRSGYASRLALAWALVAACSMSACDGCASKSAATASAVDASSIGDTGEPAMADASADAGLPPVTVDAVQTGGCPGGPRCACGDNSGCDAGYCVATRAGGVCAASCAGAAGCLADEVCAGAPGRDLVYVCLPRWASLCAPCRNDDDCRTDLKTEQATCVAGGEAGAFCSGPCDKNSLCPNGFACDPATAACKPLSGACECSAWAVQTGATTDCHLTNAAGTCTAHSKCAEIGALPTCLAQPATAESCNGQDDDCNGKTDENEELLCEDNNVCTKDQCTSGQCVHPSAAKAGDGVCQTYCGETAVAAPECSVCGDDLCAPGESPKTCAQDCCGGCGDGKCTGYECGENPKTCATDCSTACGNKLCDKGESPVTCAIDCNWQVCGNGQCEPSDGGPAACPSDCGKACGNCVCDKGEDFAGCPLDCGFCGDGVCSPCAGLGESQAACPKDCGGCPAGCDDGVVCSLDQCAGNTCVHASDASLCNDGNPCTDDVCDAKKGCLAVPNNTTCAGVCGKKVTFAIAAGNGLHVVMVAGTFNSWASTPGKADVLTDPTGSGVWSIDKNLAAGVHQYKFIVDGMWQLDPTNPEKMDDGFGTMNSVVQVAACAP